jgi:hypothetical protein
MNIYIPLLYICMAGKCGFFQSETYTTDEQNCEQEIAAKKAEYATEIVIVQAICIDINLNTRKTHEPDSKLQPT